MLILGRMILGVGIDFSNQAVPLYLSKMAPTKWRKAPKYVILAINNFGHFDSKSS